MPHACSALPRQAGKSRQQVRHSARNPRHSRFPTSRFTWNIGINRTPSPCPCPHSRPRRSLMVWLGKITTNEKWPEPGRESRRQGPVRLGGWPDRGVNDRGMGAQAERARAGRWMPGPQAHSRGPSSADLRCTPSQHLQAERAELASWRCTARKRRGHSGLHARCFTWNIRLDLPFFPPVTFSEVPDAAGPLPASPAWSAGIGGQG